MAQDLPQLRDIHLPAEPSWWPPAPGWWIVSALVLALVVFAFMRWQAPRRRRARRDRLIVATLVQHAAQWRRDGDDAHFVAALSEHLRRLSRVVRADAAALTGAAWIAFLDRHGDGFAAVGDALVDAQYRPAAPVDAAALYAVVEKHTRRVLATELADV
jgi:hypothetical protein